MSTWVDEPVVMVSHFAQQLSEPKLEQLLDRWTGVEWFAPGFDYLDRPLYEALPPSRRALPPGLVEELVTQHE